jgi:hypothetical protein
MPFGSSPSSHVLFGRLSLPETATVLNSFAGKSLSPFTFTPTAQNKANQKNNCLLLNDSRALQIRLRSRTLPFARFPFFSSHLFRSTSIRRLPTSPSNQTHPFTVATILCFNQSQRSIATLSSSATDFKSTSSQPSASLPDAQSCKISTLCLTRITR